MNNAHAHARAGTWARLSPIPRCHSQKSLQSGTDCSTDPAVLHFETASVQLIRGYQKFGKYLHSTTEREVHISQ